MSRASMKGMNTLYGQQLHLNLASLCPTALWSHAVFLLVLWGCQCLEGKGLKVPCRRERKLVWQNTPMAQLTSRFDIKEGMPHLSLASFLITVHFIPPFNRKKNRCFKVQVYVLVNSHTRFLFQMHHIELNIFSSHRHDRDKVSSQAALGQGGQDPRPH
jgi:hypothetical protein